MVCVCVGVYLGQFYSFGRKFLNDEKNEQRKKNRDIDHHHDHHQI